MTKQDLLFGCACGSKPKGTTPPPPPPLPSN